MESELEFPEIDQKERELIKSYRDVQTNFMPAEGFFDVPRNGQLRSHAVSIIAKVTHHFNLRFFADELVSFFTEKILVVRFLL